MSKTAIITYGATYEFDIGQLTEQDMGLIKESLGVTNLYIDFAEFYRLFPDFQGDILSADKCFRLANHVENELNANMHKSLAKRLMTELGTNTLGVNLQVLSYPEQIFLYSDGGVCLVVRATCSIEAALDKSQKINKPSLKNVIELEGMESCFRGELQQRLNESQINDFNIEYR